MKTLLFKRRCDPHNRIKSFSIQQENEDQECITRIRKSFRYDISIIDQVDPEPNPANVYIKKYFGSEKRIEKFSFQVKGTFCLTHKQQLLKVEFSHALNIHIYWKTKNFSPKKKSDNSDLTQGLA